MLKRRFVYRNKDGDLTNVIAVSIGLDLDIIFEGHPSDSVPQDVQDQIDAQKISKNIEIENKTKSMIEMKNKLNNGSASSAEIQKILLSLL